MDSHRKMLIGGWFGSPQTGDVGLIVWYLMGGISLLMLTKKFTVIKGRSRIA